jgi:iron complex transport system substrate-binding protein
MTAIQQSRRSLGGGILLLALAAIVLPVSAQQFPLSIEHKFGVTTIPAQPERVVSVDYAGADDLLALGVQPVAIRYWYGEYPRAVWPWAEPLLKDTPVILRGELDFEAIAATTPDLIIALWSGIDAAEYEKLSLIAPVVAVPAEVGDFALPWAQRALIAGEAVGKLDEAQRQVKMIRARLAAIAKAHPDWNGKSAAVAFAWSGPESPGAYTSTDVRPQLLAEMGFQNPEAVDAMANPNGGFTIQVSPEDLSAIDADLLIWVADGSWDNVRDILGRPFMNATKQGHDVFAGPLVSSAFSHASLASLPYALEHLLPMIEAALDGDPDTHADNRPADI